MIIIKTKDGSKYWTEGYTEEQGFLKFSTTTRSGKEIEHVVAKNEVTEISKTDGDFKD